MSDPRKDELDDLRKAMKSYHGRRMLYRLLSVTGVFNNPWTPCHATLSYLTGQRSIGCIFEADIREVDADSYTLMIKEAQARMKAKEKAHDEEDFEVL